MKNFSASEISLKIEKTTKKGKYLKLLTSTKIIYNKPGTFRSSFPTTTCLTPTPSSLSLKTFLRAFCTKIKNTRIKC